MLLLPILAISGFAAAQDLSPLEIRNMRALSLPFLRIDPRGQLLGKDQKEWSVQFLASNNARTLPGAHGSVIEDFEKDDINLRFRKGLGQGLDFGIEAPIISRGPGFLDPFIAWWHRTFVKFHAEFREDSPLGQSEIILPGHGRYGSATGLGDLTLDLTKQVTPNLLATGALKVPTGQASRLLGSGAVDLGLAVQWHAKLNSRWDVHAQAGYVYQGKSSELPEARRNIWQGAVALVYRHNSKDVLVIQWQGEPSALVTGSPESDSLHTMGSLGYRRMLGDGKSAEIYMSEDGDWLGYHVPWLVNMAPDFTVGVRYTSRF